MKVPEGWEVRKLGEIADLNPRESLCRGNVYPYIDMSSVPENNRLPERVLYKEYRGSGSKFRKGDVLFARITPCLENGKTAFIKDLPQDEVGFGSTEFIVIRQKKGISNGLFLYYLSRWNTFREIAKKKMSGTSGRQRVSAQALANINVPYPPLPEQEKIAEILGSIDNQIENLMEQNKTLEEIAKTIFKRWFIDFEFPNEEGKSYKSSGGEFVDSELGKIPKGWKVGYIGDGVLTRIIPSGIKKFEEEKKYIATANVKEGNILGFDKLITFNQRPSRANMQPIINSVWIAKMIDSIKHLVFTEENKKWVDEYILSTGFLGLKCDENSVYYVYEFIKHPKFWKIKDGLANGAVQLAINNTSVKQIKILVPDDITLRKFRNYLKPIYSKLFSNIDQIQTLTQLRDTLLPKLITGEIRVKV